MLHNVNVVATTKSPLDAITISCGAAFNMCDLQARGREFESHQSLEIVSSTGIMVAIHVLPI
jgi:hypothetical protein